MARPRIFISSTFYDLKHIRASLEAFVSSLGYDPVLSEKGSIAYSPDVPLDESCYQEVRNADIFVLIVGGRYGSAASGEEMTRRGDSFYERYKSITRGEYERAVENDTPTYILVEKMVYAEYETFKRNRDNSSVKYAHVDSANVFHLLDDVLDRPRNNPMYLFERAAEIEEWLRSQWAGLFREMIRQRSERGVLATMAGQVAQLSEVTQTLKRYLETVVNKVSAEEAPSIIEHETERLREATRRRDFELLPFVRWVARQGMPESELEEQLRSAKDYLSFMQALVGKVPADEISRLLGIPDVLDDVNIARATLGLPRFPQTIPRSKAAPVVTPNSELPQRRRRPRKPPETP